MQDRNERLVDEFVEKWTSFIYPPSFSVDFESEVRDLAFQLTAPEPPEPSTPWSDEPPRRAITVE
jgi:hypothetical protein